MPEGLIPDTHHYGDVLEFDLPGVRIGTAEYEQGPTGVTVFHFPDKAKAVVDIGGGLPGTYNTEFLKLLQDHKILDAIGISGGSWYGLQAVSGIAEALKEDGHNDGHHTRLANVAGAIIYDFGDRRANEICPDAALGRAAVRAAREGVFPLGAHGAGRMAMQGAFFGASMHSGQGAAVRRIGEITVACFVVANPLGMMADRHGNLITGGASTPWGAARIQEAMAHLPLARQESGLLIEPTGQGARPNPANTTISVVVTNADLPVADLNRLAIQTHRSMSRGIQPFATALDGDVLFAVSTCEKPLKGVHMLDVCALAGEVMWDALSTTCAPRRVSQSVYPCAKNVDFRAATFEFGPGFALDVRLEGGSLLLCPAGHRPVFDLLPGNPAIRAEIADTGRFEISAGSSRLISGGYFTADEAGDLSGMVLNPGAWQQYGRLAGK